ncbi:MAG: ABC transporter ATP-binding protein [Oscillospiraceae bacterium]|nr:ABC transporter ATP-binding protein [Oscillospiraceae bacterium]
MVLIKAEGLSLGYDSKAIVSGLNFEVNEGDYLCIIGHNGSGKTTLMRTLLGLLKPLSGEVVFEGGLRKNEIGYLPQQTQIQKDFPASIEEIVISGCVSKEGFKPFFSKEDRVKAKANMEKMGLSGMEKRSYRDLSGGQQQRVLLARALCATERVLLLDEPVAGLDPDVTEEMYSVIEKLNHEGTTIIMISHDISATLKYATHILHMGDTVFFGTKENYLKSMDRQGIMEDIANG